MTDTTSQPASETTPAPGSDSAAQGGSEPVVPAGYVPQSELEKVRQDAFRQHQSELDRLRAELAKAKQPPKADPAGDSSEGFDPAEFRRTILRDALGATQLASAASEVRAAFPHADPALFAPEQLAQFGSPEALRFAAEDSHRRVAAILDAEKARIEKSIREELAAQAGGSAGPAGHTLPPGGDPSIEQLAAMSVAELNAVEKSNPGVIQRVMGKAA